MRKGNKPYSGRRRRVWLRALLALVLLGALAFAGLFAAVLYGSYDHIRGEPRVMVILGCQVKPSGPSVLLRDRLDKALDYLEDHPDLTVVVSGGQGKDEPVSEARSMRDYLVEHGVAAEQIHMEDRSHNTWQNINFSQALLRELGQERGEIVVVSSGFHLTRVRLLWSRAWEGEYTLSTLAAPCSHLPSRLRMYLREPVALVKSFVFDR